MGCVSLLVLLLLLFFSSSCCCCGCGGCGCGCCCGGGGGWLLCFDLPNRIKLPLSVIGICVACFESALVELFTVFILEIAACIYCRGL